MYEARDAARLASFEDRRTWRLLLARLHPDAGGNDDLFAFACAVRDEMCRGKHSAEATASEHETRNNEGVAPFLRTWYEAMGHWSSSNREDLDSLWMR